MWGGVGKEEGERGEGEIVREIEEVDGGGRGGSDGEGGGSVGGKKRKIGGR